MSQPFNPVLPTQPPGFSGSRLLLSVSLCLILGGGLAVWRAVQRIEAERHLAQAWALERATALEIALNRALLATDSMAALTRQSGGRMANFQQIAAGLKMAYPGLAVLELQPGGITTEVFPRTSPTIPGHNVGQEAVSQAALNSRQLIVSDPVVLPQAGLGVVGRRSVFVPDNRGRETFWGYVSVSVSLGDIVSMARLNTLTNQGYEAMLYALSSTTGKPMLVAQYGQPYLSSAVLQPFQVANLRLRLAVAPSGGWLRWTPLLLDCVVVLLVGGLVCLFLQSQNNHQHLQTALAEASAHLARTQEERARTEDQLRQAQKTAQTELLVALEQTEGVHAQLKETALHWQQSQQRTRQLEAELQAAEETAANNLKRAREAAAEEVRVANELFETDITTLKAAAEAIQGRLQASENQLVQAHEHSTELERQLQAIQAAHSTQSNQLATATEGNSVLQTRLLQAETVLKRQDEERVLTMQELEKARAQAEAGVQNQRLLERLQAKLAETQAETTQDKKQLAVLEAELARSQILAEQVSATRQEMDALQAKLADAEARLEALAMAPPVPREEPSPTPPSAEPALTEDDVLRHSTTAEEPENWSSIVPAAVLTDPSTEALGRSEGEPDFTPDPDATIEPDPDPEPEWQPESHSMTPLGDEEPVHLTAEETSGDAPPAESPELESADPPSASEAKPEKNPRRRKNKDENQLNLFTDEPSVAEDAPDAPASPPAKPPEEKPKSGRGGGLDLPAFKKAGGLLAMLLAEGDPGARECLADNRKTVRAGFLPEVFEDFEKQVKGNDYPVALELLKKTGRRHNLHL